MSNDLREHDVRAFLSRMASEMPTPLEVPPQAVRRARSRLARSMVVGLVTGALVVAVTISGVRAILRSAPDRPGNETPPPTLVSIHVPIEPRHIAVGDGTVWLAGQGISRIDPATNRTVRTITRVDTFRIESRLDGNAIAIGEGGVWISGGAFDGEVLRVDPETYEVLTVHSGGGYHDPYAVAVGAGAVWATNDREAAGTVGLVRIDPTERGAMRSIIPLDHPRALAIANGIVWVHDGAHLVAVDPETNSVVSRVPTDIRGDLVAGFDSLWSMNGDGSIVRIDPTAGNAYASIDVTSAEIGYDLSEVHMAVGEGAVWVALNDSDEGASDRHQTVIIRIDPSANEVRGTTRVDARIVDIAAGEGALWAVDDDGTVYRIDTDAVSIPS